MGIEVVHHQHDGVGLRIVHINQVTNHLGKVDGRAALRHLHPPCRAGSPHHTNSATASNEASRQVLSCVTMLPHRELFLSTWRCPAKGSTLNLLGFVGGRSWCTCERVGIDEARLVSRDWL